jgi:Zn-dependent protease
MDRWIRFGRARVLGARVFVHWSVLAIVGLLAFMSFRSPVHAAISIASYLGVILIHELGHALMAHRLGYEVGAIRVAFLHGRCEHEAPQTEMDEVLISWGGVLAQFTIALPVLIIATVFEEYDFGYLSPAVAFLGYVNVLVALVNLAPAPELDGHTAWRVIPLARQWVSSRRATKRTLSDLTRRR